MSDSAVIIDLASPRGEEQQDGSSRSQEPAQHLSAAPASRNLDVLNTFGSEKNSWNRQHVNRGKDQSRYRQEQFSSCTGELRMSQELHMPMRQSQNSGSAQIFKSKGAHSGQQQEERPDLDQPKSSR